MRTNQRTHRRGRSARVWMGWRGPAALGALGVLGACTHAARPLDHLPILAPHWDQVCQEESGGANLFPIDRLLDSAALIAVLEAQGEGESSHGSTRAEILIALHYEASGELRRGFLIESNLDPIRWEELERDILSTTRPQGPLLTPVHLRVHVTTGPEPTLAVLPAVICEPHLRHEDDELPRIADGISMTRGIWIRNPDPDGEVVSARLNIGRSGEVTAIEFLQGNRSLLDVIEPHLGGTPFDPMLINGEPVEGTLTVQFRIRDAAGLR